MNNLTYKDIAKKAKVSVSTVSRYYNEGYVSKNTQSKIEAIIKEFDFFPNNGARLIRGQTNSIYVIVPHHFESTYTDIIQGIESSASMKNKHVFVTHADNNITEYIEKIKYIISWKPGAIVLFLPEYNDEIEQFLKAHQNINFVIYGYQSPYSKWVKYDAKDMFYRLVKTYYHRSPMRKLIFLISDTLNKQQIEERRKAFRKATIELNIQSEEYIINNQKIEEVDKFLEYVKVNNYYDIVCSSHQLFANILAKADSNLMLKMTDIGYTSIYDYNHKYQSKIFIDYGLLGVMIEKLTVGPKKEDSYNLLTVTIL